MSTKCLLFDLDGTLLNTNNLVLESLKYTIKTHMDKDMADSQLYRYFGQPLVEIMENLNPLKAEAMVETYREYSAVKHDNLTEVFPQVPETLKELKKKGILTAVVTSKIKRLAYRGLGLFQLEDYFDVCVAFEDTEKHKPDPEPVLKAMELLGVSGFNDDVIMVGDSPYDIMCANSAGVTSAVVEWSLHPAEVLQACKPHIWLPEFSVLLNYV